jgi:hypothetical protein
MDKDQKTSDSELKHFVGYQSSEVEWHLVSYAESSGCPLMNRSLRNVSWIKEFVNKNRYVTIRNSLMNWESHLNIPKTLWHKIWGLP